MVCSCGHDRIADTLERSRVRSVPVKRHRGEPGHTRAHGHTDEPHNHPNPPPHPSDRETTESAAELNGRSPGARSPRPTRRPSPTGTLLKHDRNSENGRRTKMSAIAFAPPPSHCSGHFRTHQQPSRIRATKWRLRASQIPQIGTRRCRGGTVDGRLLATES